MKIVTLCTLLALSAGLSAGEEVSWQKKTAEQSRREAAKEDHESFISVLSPHGRQLFREFNADQKKKAMDYADNGKMSPDSAVSKVAGQ